MELPAAPFQGLAFARSLPHAPGVYRYYDRAGKLLYVGKARDLQKRVLSYFRKTPDDPRIASMVSQVARAEFSVVNTETEALVLEARLIRQDRPHYNIRLREGGEYPYLHLSTDKPVPQLTIRRDRKAGSGRYFGPYPSRHAVYVAHEALCRHFGLRTCSDTFFAHRSRPCLEYQIGRCSAPCVGKISPNDYAARVAELEAFLDGRGQSILDAYVIRMEKAADQEDFERAAQLRDRIAALRSVQGTLSVEAGSGSFDALACRLVPGLASVAIVVVRAGAVVGHKNVTLDPPPGATPQSLLAQFVAQHYLVGGAPVPGELLCDPLPDDADILAQALGETQDRRVGVVSSVRGDRRSQLDLAVRNAQASLEVAAQSHALMELRRRDLAKLLDLPAPPQRMECFDISHTQGESAVASCVVFGPEGPQKKSYRKFNIRDITPGDDYAAIRQAVERRMKGSEPKPDLLLIDGGAGQVAQAVEVVRGLGLTFPIVGVSKGPERRAGEEDLIIDDGASSIYPGPDRPGLHLINAIRDEAHRFALHSHRNRREKTRVRSTLLDIPGVGATRRRALLTTFGGLAGLKSASPEQIAQVPGIGLGLAKTIAAHLAKH